MNTRYLSGLSRGLSLLLFIGGVLTSGVIVSGDDMGRVNLLYFILLFVMWPFLSFSVLLLFKIFPKTSKFPLINSLLSLPIWPRSWLDSVYYLQRHQLLNPWFVLQSQIMTLAFSIGCLCSFFTVLLFNDITFVWRSTLLNAEQIYPVLKMIALPWFFLESAQPLKDIFIATQEIRTAQQAPSLVNYGQWWSYLLMAQLVYAIAPRLITVLISRFRFNKKYNAYSNEKRQPAPLINQPPSSPTLDKLVASKPQLDDFNVACCLQLPPSMLKQLLTNFSTPNNVFQVGFHGSIADEQLAISDQKDLLVLVAAWEPPMGELKDFLDQGRGIIMPLDFKEQQWQPLSQHYLDEWRRFSHQLDNWKIYVDEELK
ncbi:MAG: DUF2868 domain-containing protein [Psychrobium sp.]|nr:DUF2868 domain-containing protein [Psychrobium sp.]